MADDEFYLSRDLHDQVSIRKKSGVHGARVSEDDSVLEMFMVHWQIVFWLAVFLVGGAFVRAEVSPETLAWFTPVRGAIAALVAGGLFAAWNAVEAGRSIGERLLFVVGTAVDIVLVIAILTA